jgi:hypothetical protein
MRKWLVQLAAPLLVAALLLAGALELGRRARRDLAPGPRHTLAFASIDCTPPGPLSREDFLGEVQYLAGLPDQLNLLDDRLPDRLVRAFAGHPWVQVVQRLDVTAAPRVRVQLHYRTPVLGVQRGGVLRAVDAHGVLLPATAATEGLPVFRARALGPNGPEGTVWNDPAVLAAARTAAFLSGEQGRLKLAGVQPSESGLVLSTPAGSRVLWGHAPDAETADEAGAAQKLERLLRYCRRHGDLDHPDAPREHDVRSPAVRPSGDGK